MIIADAVRFGNGMGSINQGNGVSGYPREDESSRYWVQASLGQGQPDSLYDTTGNDEQDSWSAPPRFSVEMNREQSGAATDRLHISFHSNAGGGRGTVALISSSSPTLNQAALAQLCGNEVNDDLVNLGTPDAPTLTSAGDVASKMRMRFSGGMPTPWSATVTATQPASADELKVMRPLASL